MDTCVYEVCFPDGNTKKLATNTIAEVLYVLCNPDGNQYIMLEAIVDYRKNPNVAISQNNQIKIFELAAGIAEEQAFNWWVTWVLKRRDSIISLLKHEST
ncbi:hypothetical protein ACHAW6_010362 [Cyclotella cf. meneghiniana]